MKKFFHALKQLTRNLTHFSSCIILFPLSLSPNQLPNSALLKFRPIFFARFLFVAKESKSNTFGIKDLSHVLFHFTLLYYLFQFVLFRHKLLFTVTFTRKILLYSLIYTLPLVTAKVPRKQIKKQWTS